MKIIWQNLSFRNHRTERRRLRPDDASPNTSFRPNNISRTSPISPCGATSSTTINLESADIGINDADDKIDNGLSDYITGSRNAASQPGRSAHCARSTTCSNTSTSVLTERWPPNTGRGPVLPTPTSTSSKCAPTATCPITTTCLGSTDADVYKGARRPRLYVMDRVLEDFDFAARNLPGTWESGNTRA